MFSLIAIMQKKQLVVQARAILQFAQFPNLNVVLKQDFLGLSARKPPLTIVRHIAKKDHGPVGKVSVYLPTSSPPGR